MKRNLSKNIVMLIVLLSIFLIPVKHNVLISNKEYKEGSPLSNDVEKISLELQINKKDNDNLVDISFPDLNYNYNKIVFIVWSEDNGQDDVVWYEAKKNNNNLMATVPIKNHKSFGNYIVDVYGFDAKGNPTFLKRGNFTIDKPQVVSSSFDYNPENNNIDVKIKFDSSNITNVQIPIWSDSNGQDDVVWYNASKDSDESWVVHTNISKHNFFVGNYTAHVYINTSNGIYSFIAGLNGKISPKNKVTASPNQDQSGFTINYADYSNFKGYNLMYAVWSENNGQDDVVWYNANNGRVEDTFSNHLNNSTGKADSGKYIVHFYVFKNGRSYFVESTEFFVDNPKSITIDASQNGESIEVYVRNLPSSVKGVSIPVWSESGGQDDVIWYGATNIGGGTWKSTINLKNHHYDFGKYIMHAYVNYGNKTQIFVTTCDVVINVGTLNTPVPNGNETSVYVSLTDSVYANDNVSFAVWSEINGQDDVVWYGAKKSGNTLYYNIPINKHRTSGKYYVHVYHGSKYITQTEFYITPIDFNINIEEDKDDVNGDNIYYKVIVNGIDSKSGVSQVYVPVWTTDNQNDVYWYPAQQETNGDYVAYINPKNHKYNSGNYHTHVYVTGNNGVQKCKIANDVRLDLKIKYEIQKPQHKANTTIRIYNTPPSIKIVQLPTWSEFNGLDDVVWYSGTKNSDGSWSFTVKSSDHPPLNPTSHVFSDIYVDGTMRGRFDYDINKFNLEPWYYSQLNPAWSGWVYGRKNIASSGCMPSSIAMAISGILDKYIPPNQVADYLYYSTNEFNKFYDGSSGMAVKLSSIHYGVSYKVLNTYEKLVAALDNGQIVIGAVGLGYFVTNPLSTHAIVMYGYENGKTNVYDPYRESKNGKYSVLDIYNQQSHVPEDLNAGAAFHALY